MKHIAYCLIIVASITLSCASSNSVIKDDAYFSPYENNVTNNSELATSADGNFSSSTIKSGTDYKYQGGTESSDSTSNTSVYIIDDSPKVSFGIGVGFGWPYYYGSFYYCWDPFYYPYFSYCWDPFYYPYYGYCWDPSTIRITDTGGIRSGMVMGTSIIRTTHTIHRITPTLRGITTTVITGQRITGWAVWQATGA